MLYTYQSFLTAISAVLVLVIALLVRQCFRGKGEGGGANVFPSSKTSKKDKKIKELRAKNRALEQRLAKLLRETGGVSV